MGEQWSTDTRDLVAATMLDHQDYLEPGAIRCTCGATFLGVVGAVTAAGAFYVHKAEAVLTALTEAGALLPAGGQTSDEWRVTYRHNCHPTLAGIAAGPCRTVPHREVWLTAISEADARRGLATCRDEANWPEPRIETRTVTTWPTSSVYYGPWREVADG